jgi:hypothetical protein
MSREAMQMALEALESVTGHFTRTPSTLRDSEVRGDAHKAITVLRQALVDADDTSQKRVDEKEKREQEPVAWLSTDCIGERYLCFTKPKDNDPVQPLYTTPPKREWVGLTDEEIQKVVSKKWWDWEDAFDIEGFSRAIEAKLKEKNT